MDKEITNNHESERSLPYHLVRRIVTLAVIFGILGGVTGGYIFLRYIPNVIPTSKQSVLLQESSAAIDVAKKVSPSVVSITSESTGFSFFGRTQTTRGAGTGIIVTNDGLILTNKHVVADATALRVYTSDGKEYKDARVVARDPFNDIAFIKIDGKGLKEADLGDSSQVVVGTRVIAIGNALGQFQNTVTEGIISGLGRPVVAGDEQGSGEQLQNMFQTDAAINPGNSGGPLVDLAGRVIGINTAVAGNAQGIGFAIPINEAKNKLESVRTRGKIVQPYLGVRYIPVTKEFAASNSLPVSDGAYVSGGQSPGTSAVIEGSPAAKAGIREGDIITKVGGKPINKNQNLSGLLGELKVGDKAALTLIREGKEQTVEVTLEEAPQAE